MSLFAGRMGRRAFLLAYACWLFAAVAIALSTGSKPLADAIGLAPWLWMATRRLHDFNARWWWSLAPFTVGFVGGFLHGVAERFSTAHAAELSVQNQAPIASQVDWAAAAQHPWDFAVAFADGFSNAIAARIAAHPFGFFLDTVFLVLLMLWPGTPGPNRFGEPPGQKPTAPGNVAAVSATFD